MLPTVEIHSTFIKWHEEKAQQKLVLIQKRTAKFCPSAEFFKGLNLKPSLQGRRRGRRLVRVRKEHTGLLFYYRGWKEDSQKPS